MSSRLLDPSEWKLAGVRWFLPRGKHHISRSTFRLVCRPVMQRVEYPPGRILIVSDNLALVLALCKGRSTKFHIAFSHASNLCVWFPGQNLSLSFRWISSELNYSDKGSHFFECALCNSSKSLLHVLAQRSDTVFRSTDMRPGLLFTLH